MVRVSPRYWLAHRAIQAGKPVTPDMIKDEVRPPRPAPILRPIRIELHLKISKAESAASGATSKTAGAPAQAL
jgi:hypothetical protein